MADFIQLMHAVADAFALLLTGILAWGAFFLVGPLLCVAVVLLRLAGEPAPADAATLFAGTAAAWALALAVTVLVRVVRAAWARVFPVGTRARAARARRGFQGAAAAAGPSGTWTWTEPRAPAPGPFGFSFRDPWVAWTTARVRAAQSARTGTTSGAASGASGTATGRTSGARRASTGRTDPRQRATPPPPPREKPRPAEPDPHAVLGVARGSSRDEIRRAYRALVKQYHPDRVNDLPHEFRKVAHQRTMEIRRAYESLGGGRPRT